jgi:hypothetical protein
MQHEGQGQTPYISDDQPDWTMPCKGLQALGLRDEESEHCRMKRLVGRYRHAEERQTSICRRKSKRTLSKPRKVLTRTHSSLVSLSSRILSRLVESCSSHRSSSTKVSMHCKKRIINTNLSFGIHYAHLFFFRPDQASNTLTTTAPSCQE